MNLPLDDEQLKALSQITADAGQVFLALTVVPFVFGIDKAYPSVLLSGIVLTFGCWALSLLLVSRKRRNDRRK